MQTNLMALAEAKELLNLSSSTTYDQKILIYLPIIENYIKTYCNNRFEDGFPEGLKLVFIDMIKFRFNQESTDTSLKAEKIGNITKTFDSSYPVQIVSALDAYRNVRFI